MHGVSKFKGLRLAAGRGGAAFSAQAPSDAAFPEVPLPAQAGNVTNLGQYRKAGKNLVMT
ncbi:hypothetical protein ASE30_22590 [Achromobacter sp. Root83]|nr:hypothetical protein ASE30_22590 [Achromobacter sp. Root83]